MSGCVRCGTGASAVALVAMVVTGCAESSSLPGLGLDLQLRVSEAQLQRGPQGVDAGGPEVSQLLRQQPEVVRGEGTVKLGGRLGAGGVALHMGAVGDDDHWVLLPKGFDFVVSDELLWDAQLQFSPAIQGDRLDVWLQAADADGRLGPATLTDFAISPLVPAAQLLVSLGWDAPVDLDLHVQTPDGLVVGAKNQSTLQPAAGEVLPPDAWMDAGVFAFDSNQQCRLDLRNVETVAWAGEPVSGTYRVYAHLYAPCGQAVVNFTSTVALAGQPIAEASSTQYEFDSRIHPRDGEAPGLLILEFEVP